ncbi:MULTISPECIES: hypothetical protein [unclassified Streptomyces]|uniref:hypothetical protein n=1 Tax=unclassified Streptomyces TaxID=2593676 RepID=UPI002253720A|nr:MULTISPECIES: hypothetical protein [unclassified Streptomyces]MCX5141453.1 hypothetical protein [Streptomyces sp. NBC_00338]
MRQRSRGRVALAAFAAMCAVAALPGQAYADGANGAYAFDPGAKPVTGAEVNTEASELKAGSVYKSTIKAGQKLYYRLNLAATTNAYVSAVVVPKGGGKVAYGDGVTVSIRDNSDLRCSSEDAHFESAEYPRPIAAYAYRTVEKDSSTCQGAGTFNVLVERESKDTSGPEDWDLELRYETEPELAEGGSMPTNAPEEWPSASPEPPAAAADNRRQGGSSYYDATSLETGEWKDEITPGQTLFYRVPVDWGQQVFATAGLGNSTGTEENEYIGNALAMSLDNPAHGHVDDVSPMAYSGKPASVSLDPVPPVAYNNRFDSDSSVSAMRFAGWYYLSVSLSPEVGTAYGKKPFPLTLTVKVDGEAKGTPYKGDAGIFSVTQDDKDMAKNGQSDLQAAESKSDTMKLVGAAGIGAGAVLVIALGAWTLLARRRASSAGSGQSPYGGPPQAW